MRRDIATYVRKCSTYAKVKTKHQEPLGLLQQPEVPRWKWEQTSKDFITKLPRTKKGHDVIIEQLSKFAHFLSFREDYKIEKLAQLNIDEIFSHHGVLISIISNRDSRFTSRFWQTIQRMLGIRLEISTVYHPQTDGLTERTIQTLEDRWRACAIDFGGSWDQHLPLVEFSYNNSYHTSIQCAPYEALYGQKCRLLLSWTETGESKWIGHDLVQETTDKISVIRDGLKTARDRQKSYTDDRRKPLEFQVNDKVLSKVSPWKGIILFRKRDKLSPRYVGPYEIVERIGPVAYKLKLPQESSAIHDTFYVSNLKKCFTDELAIVPPGEIQVGERLCFRKEPVEILGREVKRLRRSKISILRVRWKSRHGPEFTWEREDHMKRNYPHLFNQESVQK